MPPWEQLLKARKPMLSPINSGHMLECAAKVREKYPNVAIEQVAPQSWRLVSDGIAISNAHNSHYQCWIEARELLDVAD